MNILGGGTVEHDTERVHLYADCPGWFAGGGAWLDRREIRCEFDAHAIKICRDCSQRLIWAHEDDEDGPCEGCGATYEVASDGGRVMEHKPECLLLTCQDQEEVDAELDDLIDMLTH